jgi:hypothetical protein
LGPREGKERNESPEQEIRTRTWNKRDDEKEGKLWQENDEVSRL